MKIFIEYKICPWYILIYFEVHKILLYYYGTLNTAIIINY